MTKPPLQMKILYVETQLWKTLFPTQKQQQGVVRYCISLYFSYLLTIIAGTTSDLGGFGAFFDVRAAGFVDPILVSGISSFVTSSYLWFSAPSTLSLLHLTSPQLTSLFSLDLSGTDGVGTKLIVAQKTNSHSTVGIDLVAMCVNDVVVHGAEPLFFLDYFATGKIDVKTTSDVIRGIAEVCTLRYGMAVERGRRLAQWIEYTW